jgi:transposase
LAGLKLDHAAHRIVLAEYLHAIEVVESSLERLEQEIAAMSETGELAATVSGLQTLRGVALVTAATLVAEIGDIARFKSPRQLMSYSGLVPSEHSSGGSQRRGSITKAGNAHIRHVVVEAAWHYRHIPRVGEGLRKRSEGQPEKLKEISWRAQSRLNRKYRRMSARGKTKQVTVVAVARELLGFVWAVAKETQSGARQLAAN